MRNENNTSLTLFEGGIWDKVVSFSEHVIIHCSMSQFNLRPQKLELYPEQNWNSFYHFLYMDLQPNPELLVHPYEQQ